MTESLQQTRTLYEISMSIGNSLDFRGMLEESVSSYVRELGCSAAVVLQAMEEPEGIFGFKRIFSIPRNAAKGFSGFEIPDVLSRSELEEFNRRLPVTGRGSRESHSYLMELPGFGLLLLAKPGEPLNEPLLQALRRLNSKLARAAVACIEHEKTAAAVLETEDREAGRALLSASRRFQEIIEFLPDPVLVLDNNRKVIAWNRAIEDLTGLPKEEVIGKDDYSWTVPFYGARRPHLLDLLDLSDPELESKYENVRRKGGKISAEAFVPKFRSGRGAYVFATAAPLFDSEGNRIGAIETIRDITEHKKAGQAIIRAERKYRSIFENAVMGIFQITPRGELISANNAFAAILGYGASDELLKEHSNLSGYLHAEPDRYSELVRKIEKFGVIHEFEFQFRRKDDGSMAWLSVNARAVRDEKGDVEYLEGTAQDITGRKLLEDRLIQSQKMEAIGTLAGGIAHDFNNILAAVMGFAEMAKMALEDPKLTGYMEQILHAGDRAKNLVAQILAFSRADKQEKQPLDIGSVMDEARKFLRATLPSTIELRLSKAPDVPAVLADRTQIHQVVINLCTNSAHAMQEGGVIEIDLDNFEVIEDMKGLDADLGPGHYAKITVSDTGTGIDPAIISRIFDPFFTTKKQGEGTGLGLSVVYGIVRDFDGVVTVRSDPGWGTVFTVYLPAIAADVASVPEQPGAFPRGTERILFVDDEALLVEMGKGMLEDIGYKVTATTDSNHALHLFRENPRFFDLVITDTTMPNLNGIELSGEILRIRPDIPIVLCTGFSELVGEEDAAALGITKFLMKPFSLHSIAEVIRGALDRN